MRIKVASGDTITAVLAGAQTSADPKALVRTSDINGDVVTPVSLNGVTAVTLMTGVANGSYFEGLTLCNTDTGAITVTLKWVVGGTAHTITKQTLQVDETLLADGAGLRVIDSTGRIKGSFVAGTSVDVQMASAGQIVDANGNELIQFPATVASAVNEITVTNAATAGTPTISATGGDTDINLTLTPKGAGFVITDGPFQCRDSVAVTATVGGGTTGLIPAGSSLVVVTSDNADKQISLPAATVGDRIRILVGATGCELISAVAAHKVNDVVVGATNEAALTATNLYDCQYVATNTWVVIGYTKLGAVQAALVPDALA